MGLEQRATYLHFFFFYTEKCWLTYWKNLLYYTVSLIETTDEGVSCTEAR